MESVKGNSDWKQNVQMRRLIDDPDSREQPLKILEQKVSVFKEPKHAQIHAKARNQPATSCMFSGFAHSTAKPKIHRGGPEQKRGERRVPGAIKNITGYDEQIFSGLPRTNAPVGSDNDHIENNEREGIKEHGEATIELHCRERRACYAIHIEADL
jgi:hypothetical protein